MNARLKVPGLMAVGLALAMARAAAAPPETTGLVADISSHQIEITSNFSGTKLLLFGAIDWAKVPFEEWQRPVRGPGKGRSKGKLVDLRADRAYDIIVVVRGPDLPIKIRKKDRVAGIWINREQASLQAMPSFYALAATQAPADILLPDELAHYALGFSRIPLVWRTPPPPGEEEAYRAAVLRRFSAAGLYSERPQALAVIGDTLFRTEIYFPVNVPIGSYQADIYLVRNGLVVIHQTTPLKVDKIGVERAIHAFAMTRPALYGVLAVVMAVVAGLMAGWLSRRFSR